MIVKVLTELNSEFLSLKEGCTGASESTLVKMPNCWKSHVTAHIYSDQLTSSASLSASMVMFDLKNWTDCKSIVAPPWFSPDHHPEYFI